MLKKLESLYPQSNGWTITRARKAHIDHFRGNNPHLEEIADVIEERRFDKMREAVEKLTIDIK